MSNGTIDRDFSIDGSLVVITGGSSGIGKETARKLSRSGATVILGCRNLEKAKSAKSEIEYKSENPVKILQLDLSSFDSIHNFYENLLEIYGVPDVLINNAGVYTRKHAKSADGIELTMAVNYYGTFYLTNLLLPHMLDISGETRIVNVTSDAYYVGSFLADLGKSKKLKSFKAYAMSKRAVMYFTFELAKRLKKSNITVNCVHPGHSSTGIWPSDVWYWKFISKIMSLTADPASYAAENVVYTASSEDLLDVSGRYIMDLAITDVKKEIFFEDIQSNLWDFSINELKEHGIVLE